MRKLQLISTIDMKSVLLGVLTTGLFVMMTSLKPNQDTVTCKALVVVNDAGDTIALIKQEGQGGGIYTFNNEGKWTAFVGTLASGGRIETFGHDGKIKSKIAIAENGGYFYNYNQYGQPITYCGPYQTTPNGLVATANMTGNWMNELNINGYERYDTERNLRTSISDGVITLKGMYMGGMPGYTSELDYVNLRFLNLDYMTAYIGSSFDDDAGHVGIFDQNENLIFSK